MKTSTFILSIVKPNRRYLVYYALFTIVQVVFSLFTLASLIPLLEIIFGSQNQSLTTDNPSMGFGQLKAWLTQELSSLVETTGQPIYAIYGIAVLLITASCIQNASRYLGSRAMTKLRARVYANLREKLYKGINSASLHYIKSHRRGQILSKASNDLTEIEHGILNIAEALFRDSLTIVALLYVLFSIQTMLTLFILALIAVVAVLIGSIGRQLKRDSKSVQHDQGRLMDFFSEAITGFRLFKAYGVEKNERSRFNNLNDSWKKGYQSMLFRKYLASPLTEFLAIIVVASILIVGSLFVFNGKLLASEFIFFIAAFGYIVGPAKSLSSAFFSYQRGSAAAERIQHFLSEVSDSSKTSVRDISNVESLTMAQHLRIENLSFAYEDQSERVILNDLSINIQKGQHIALVGASGSGKSTLFDLILGFYNPTKGSISLDGKSIRDLNIEAYRRCFGLVTQDPILLHDTIRQNLTLGKSFEEHVVIECCKKADAWEFIQKASSGLDTVIGDRGLQLSGGQRQRLTIARALLFDPDVLLLDEATSSLDSAAEQSVLNALKTAMKGRTTFSIAHRLSTIQNADEILVLQEGKITERGNHASLIQSKGLYFTLYQAQNHSKSES